MKKSTKGPTSKASHQINSYITEFPDWRGATLTALRKTILAASPGLTEEWK